MINILFIVLFFILLILLKQLLKYSAILDHFNSLGSTLQLTRRELTFVTDNKVYEEKCATGKGKDNNTKFCNSTGVLFGPDDLYNISINNYKIGLLLVS